MTERDTPERAGAGEPAKCPHGCLRDGDVFGPDCDEACAERAGASREEPDSPKPRRDVGEADTDFSYRLLSWYAKPQCPRCKMADRVGPQHGGVYLAAWGCGRCHNTFGRGEALDAMLREDLAAAPLAPLAPPVEPPRASVAALVVEGRGQLQDNDIWRCWDEIRAAYGFETSTSESRNAAYQIFYSFVQAVSRLRSSEPVHPSSATSPAPETPPRPDWIDSLPCEERAAWLIVRHILSVMPGSLSWNEAGSGPTPYDRWAADGWRTQVVPVIVRALRHGLSEENEQ